MLRRSPMIIRRRQFPVGAELSASDEAHFRVWAPRRRSVLVLLESPEGTVREAGLLAPEEGGYFSGLVAGIRPGEHYRFLLDGEGPFADPASRFQPRGPGGPSRLVDPGRFIWTDLDWKGATDPVRVIYELHVGTFTREGTWAAAERRLEELLDLGVTVVELLPVAEFPGRFGWGYDGVCPFAPCRLYGEPDDFRRFVDRAHGLGIAVILDVVYNHFGPDGCVMGQYAAEYFTRRYKGEWGSALNFDGPRSAGVREFFAANAAYWISEFHLDGLRFDATQALLDGSDEHVLARVARAAREAAGDRALLLVAENEPQRSRLARPASEGGYGLDALWNDDFHHSARVALTGKREAYYSDYAGRPQELISALKRGYLYQGQYYAWQGKTRGSPGLDLPATRFIHYLENHDQVANSAAGRRLWSLASPGLCRALTSVLLLGPPTPLLFQGQETGTSDPFLYFADHVPELAAKVRDGRRRFLAQFPSLAGGPAQPELAAPEAEATFLACKPSSPGDARIRALHRDLIRLRRTHAAFAQQDATRLDGAVLSERAFLLRFFEASGDDRLLLVNLGEDLELKAQPEPLLAPPAGATWEAAWSTEDPAYGGEGMRAWRWPGPLALQAQSALVLRPRRHEHDG
jgi:maltooligosyltrehalose trehalohydrolase